MADERPIEEIIANYRRIRRLMEAPGLGRDDLVETRALLAPVEVVGVVRRRRRRGRLTHYETPIGPADARRILSRLPAAARPAVLEILREHQMPLECVLRHHRQAEALMCRDRIFYVLRREYRLQLTRIGGAFRRHHTTVMHGIEQYARFYEFNDFSVWFCSQGGRGE